MHILILSNFGLGIKNFRKEIIDELLKNNYTVTISYPRDEYSEVLEKEGINFIDTSVKRRGKNPLDELILYDEYKNIFKEVTPDLILSYTIKPNIYGAILARKLKIPIIVNITGLGTAIHNESLLTKFLLKLYKYSLRNVASVFFQNESNLEYFINKKIINENIKFNILPGSGVNISKFPMTYLRKTPSITLVFIGRLMKDKGIEELLDASISLLDKYKNLYFKLIGFSDDWNESKILEFSKTDRIAFLGEQEDVRPFITEA